MLSPVLLLMGDTWVHGVRLTSHGSGADSESLETLHMVSLLMASGKQGVKYHLAEMSW